jgi:general secretion pathway protein C
MQDLFKRHFWIVGAVAALVCSVFAAKAADRVVEAKLLVDADHAPKVPIIASAPTVVKQARSKDGGALATRDIFCSECTPSAVSINTDPSAITNTALPLTLLATGVDLSKPEQSYATIINTENQRQGQFSVGDPIPGATGKLKFIHPKFIEFENNGHIERLVLLGATIAPPPPPVVATNDENKDEIEQLASQDIKKLDDTHYEIDKSLIAKVIANPMGMAKSARVVPAMKNGKPEGFKLYAIRPNSPLAMLGLQSGDTLEGVNGFQLNSVNQALEIYTKLQDSTSLQVTVQRRGQDMTLNYAIH